MFSTSKDNDFQSTGTLCDTAVMKTLMSKYNMLEKMSIYEILSPVMEVEGVLYSVRNLSIRPHPSLKLISSVLPPNRIIDEE